MKDHFSEQSAKVFPKANNNRRNTRSTSDPAGALSPEIIAALETIVKRRFIDPNAEAFSIEQFCLRYGVGRQLVYDEINAGRLTAKKAGESDRTLIRRIDAERWIENSPTIKPKLSKAA